MRNTGRSLKLCWFFNYQRIDIKRTRHVGEAVSVHKCVKESVWLILCFKCGVQSSFSHILACVRISISIIIKY